MRSRNDTAVSGVVSASSRYNRLRTAGGTNGTAAMKTLGHLEPVGGGDPIPLTRSRLLIGRRGNCDIVLKFPNVSSRHCELELRNGYWHVTDLGSRNGLKVNGVRTDRKFLLPGDELTVAKHRFEVLYTADPTAPPPEEEDVFSQSLMEKAGLEKKPQARRPKRDIEDEIPDLSELDETILDEPARPSRRPAPTPSGNSDDDAALKWLNE